MTKNCFVPLLHAVFRVGKIPAGPFADSEGKYISWQNRRLKVDAFPIRIDFRLFNSALTNDAVMPLLEKYFGIKGDKALKNY